VTRKLSGVFFVCVFRATSVFKHNIEKKMLETAEVVAAEIPKSG
jgi:hypothetical protein